MGEAEAAGAQRATKHLLTPLDGAIALVAGQKRVAGRMGVTTTCFSAAAAASRAPSAACFCASPATNTAVL